MILGIDVSRTRIACALLNHDQDLIDTHLRKLPSTDDDRLRMEMAESCLRWMARMADEESAAILGVFIEDAYAGPNIKTSMQQAQWVGCIQALCWHLWPHALNETIGNSAWRKKAKVTMQPGLPYSRPKRQDIKDATRAWAESIYGDQVKGLSEDEVDAIGVAYAGWGSVE